MAEQEALYERFQRNFDEDTLDDLVLLNEPTDVSITQLLKNRYNSKESANIYTYIGPTIVSLNPYHKLDIYANEVKHLFHSHQPYELAPHLYSLAEDAFRSMRETGQGQSIIVSGESGAGKTEAAKLIMEYIASVSVSGIVTDNIKRIILESNPILEAFGNAKTVRNDNSSRFV
jgi:myosin-1